MMNEPSILNKKLGEPLNRKEQKELGKLFEELYLDALSRRRYQRLPMPHYMLQNVTATFLRMFGYDADFEVSFNAGSGFDTERIRFDVVAEKGKKALIVEVKDKISTRDFCQLQGYFRSLRKSRVKADLYLCTDVINYTKLVSGTTGDMCCELMENEKVRIMFADKYFLIICHTHSQLMLTEMPEFLTSEKVVV